MYKRAQQGWLKHLDFILLDLACLVLAYGAAYLLRHGSLGTLFNSKAYINIGFVLLIFDLLVMSMGNTMHGVLRRGYFREFVSTIRQDILVFVGTTAFLFTVKDGDQVSRVALWLTLVLHLVISYGFRIIWKRVISNHPSRVSKRSMLLVTDQENAAAVLQRFNTNPVEGIGIKGIVLVDQDAVGQCISGVAVVATLEDTPKYICREWIDEVYISTTTPPLDLIERCSEMGVTVHRELHSAGGDQQIVEKIAGEYVLTSSMRFATPIQMFLKRSMDIVGGLVGSLIALVIIAVIGPKIKKESPGPILFKQERIGKNGKKFPFYKIRSMHLDAESKRAELMKQNRIADGRMFKIEFDPRVIGNGILPDGSHKTGIGEFIRDTSLDEFPQFFCVLRGTMSLVGTRPPLPDEWEKYEYHHRARLAIKPGITGMWQVSGRSQITNFEEVVKLDTEYINNWNLGLDIKILLKTIVMVIKRDGAM